MKCHPFCRSCNACVICRFLSLLLRIMNRSLMLKMVHRYRFFFKVHDMQLVLLICYHFQHMITYLLKRFLREKQKRICVRVIPHGLLKHRKSQMRQRQKRTYVLSKEPQKKPFIEVLCGKRYAKISLNLFYSNSNTATEQCKF